MVFKLGYKGYYFHSWKKLHLCHNGPKLLNDESYLYILIHHIFFVCDGAFLYSLMFLSFLLQSIRMRALYDINLFLCHGLNC